MPVMITSRDMKEFLWMTKLFTDHGLDRNASKSKEVFLHLGNTGFYS